MNPHTQKTDAPSRLRSKLRPYPLIAAISLLVAIPASAAEFTYQYYRFKTTKVIPGGDAIQLSEFTFSHLGTVLNLNDRDHNAFNVVSVAVSSAGQDPNGGEGPMKLTDGNTNTKWFRGTALADGNELIFNFGTGVAVDSYNFALANDNEGYGRTPASWRLAGSNNGIDWTVLDVRTDAVTSINNYAYQAGFGIPADIPPVINSYAAVPAIQINGTPISFQWDTQYSTIRTLFDGTTPTDLPAEVGSLNVTPPDNSTKSYTLTAAKAGSLSAVKSTTTRTVAGGTSSFRYVRYTITGRRGGTGSNLVQVSEFEFYNSTVSPTKLTILDVTNPGGSNTPTAGEGALKLADSNNSSKWLDFNNMPVIFDFGSPIDFDSYSFVTGNDGDDRDPVKWKLEGSNDINTDHWSLIENVDFTYPTKLARNATSGAIPLPGNSLAPLIQTLTASTGISLPGEPVTLTFSTQAASSVTIDPDPGGTLPLYGSVTVNPTVDTTYTLTATSPDTVSFVTATVTVLVVADPGDIDFADFSSVGSAFGLTGSASITAPENTLPGRLRLTPQIDSQTGAAWFVKKLDCTGGFEATFGISLNHEAPDNNPPADGLAFVIQNSPAGTNAAGYAETGLPQNALNICFHTFNGSSDGSSLVEVRNGTSVLSSAEIRYTPGVELHGLPQVDLEGNPLPTGGTPYTLASLASDAPYQIRVVYMPHNLDVYFDGIAILQNVDVDLTEIGASDVAGKSYFGFTARTGLFMENNDITNWNVNLGDFSALPPFGIVKQLFRYAPGNPKPVSVDLVWNASFDPSYDVTFSEDLANWTISESIYGEDGQLGATVDIPASVGDATKAFFRVEEHAAP